jgi:hypothetical protein
VAGVTILDGLKGKESGELTLPDVPPTISLRELIRTRVREEVAKYNADASGTFRGLVAPEGSEQTGGGFKLRKGRLVDWEKQAEVATEAFRRNGFFVLVDGRQVTELDEELELDADSEIRFVRLVPLVGG